MTIILVVRTLFSFSLRSGNVGPFKREIDGYVYYVFGEICMQVEIDNSRLSSKVL